MNYSDTTPYSLLIQCQKNTKESWEKLDFLYGKLICHWCRSAGLTEMDCDEVYQEIFLSVMRNFHTFHKDRPDQKFRKWLKSVAVSRITDFYRRKKAAPASLEGIGIQPESSLKVSVPDDEEMESSLLYQQLMKLLRQDFSERDIEVFKRLVTAVGMSSREIGEEFGITDTMVRQIKFRIKKRIQEEFSEVL